MITRLSIKRSCEGGMLLVTLVVCAVVGVMLTAYLTMVSGRHSFTQRSQVWNNCIPMCEAGVEDALAHLNHSLTTSNFAINGWVKYGTMYRKDAVTLNQGSYVVSIDSNYPPIITSTGRLIHPITGAQMTRAVRVQTKINQRFPNAILAKGLVDLGGGARVDSFNSTNATDNTGGMYDPTKFTDKAKVATTSRIPGNFTLGNGKIYGSAGTGPGGDVDLNNGAIGSTAFVNNGANAGQIEDDHYANDINVYIPDVTFPTQWGPYQPLIPGGFYNGTNYTYKAENMDYQIPSFSMTSLGAKMIVIGKVRVYVMGNTTVTAGYIQLAPGATLEWYCRNSFDLGGGGILNYPGYAKDFSVFGLPSCLSVKYSGTAKFVGTIYAPQAAIVMTGTSEAIGAFVGKTFKITGTMDVHYDEALQGDPREGRFMAASWREL